MLLSNIIADVMLYLRKVLYVGNIFHNDRQNKVFPLSGGGVQNAKNNVPLLQNAEENGHSLSVSEFTSKSIRLTSLTNMILTIYADSSGEVGRMLV